VKISIRIMVIQRALLFHQMRCCALVWPACTFLVCIGPRGALHRHCTRAENKRIIIATNGSKRLFILRKVYKRSFILIGLCVILLLLYTNFCMDSVLREFKCYSTFNLRIALFLVTLLVFSRVFSCNSLNKFYLIIQFVRRIAMIQNKVINFIMI
jgi:hypothetical protein